MDFSGVACFEALVSGVASLEAASLGTTSFGASVSFGAPLCVPASSGAVFFGASFFGASFLGLGASFSGASFSGASFLDASFAGASFLAVAPVFFGMTSSVPTPSTSGRLPTALRLALYSACQPPFTLYCRAMELSVSPRFTTCTTRPRCPSRISLGIFFEHTGQAFHPWLRSTFSATLICSFLVARSARGAYLSPPCASQVGW
ncbi:pentapeptide repeat-containing protein [Streptomyces sp. NPDC059900]|uniref:pentapeptide repeat-containing protein n=1 Tax=Streptomyces sp. NPDC059900 TaxID=3155816 RepID=UPI003D03FB06